MKFETKFNIGDRVRLTRRVKFKGPSAGKVSESETTFTVGQIRIQTLADGLILIEYRPCYLTGRNGPWHAQAYLAAIEKVKEGE